MTCWRRPGASNLGWRGMIYFFGTDYTDFTVFLDRIYRINWILFCLSTFPEESLKTKSLREKGSGIGASLWIDAPVKSALLVIA